MFYHKKKKEYSEVSENKLNINSDYFNIFQNELKNIFNKNNNEVINQTIDQTINDKVNNKKIYNDVNNEATNNLNNNFTKKMFNTNYKNIELNNNDIFLLNMFINYIENQNNK